MNCALGPYGGIKIGVRWMIGEQYGYDHFIVDREMDRMVGLVQPCVLEQITNAVRSVTTNVGGKLGMSEAQRNEGPIDWIVGRMERKLFANGGRCKSWRNARRNSGMGAEVASMDPMEMRRRLIRSSDWHGHFAHSLDGRMRFATSAVVELTVAGRTKENARHRD